MGKRALVMSGGGAKGAFQLGVVDHLIKEKNLDFDVIAGVSVGSLNAVVLAQGRGLDGLREKLEDLEQLWFGLPGNEGIYRKRFLGKLLVFIFKDSILDPGPLKEQMDTHVEEEKLRQSGKEFRIGAVTLESGEYVVIDQNTSSIKEWTLASSSMPLAFPPVKIDSDHAVDGGIRNITPLREAFTALKNAGGGSVDDPDEMYVVLASPLDVEAAQESWSTGKKIGERALDILVNEIFREDLSTAIKINQSVIAYIAARKLLEEREQLDLEATEILEKFRYRPPKYCPVRIQTILPEKNYMDVLEFDSEKIRLAFEKGQEAAQQPLDEDALANKLNA